MIKNIKEAGKGQKKAEVQVHYNDTQAVGCKHCGNTTFIPAMKIGRLSALHPKNQHANDLMLRFPTEACSKCGEEVDLSKPEKN